MLRVCVRERGVDAAAARRRECAAAVRDKEDLHQGPCSVLQQGQGRYDAFFWFFSHELDVRETRRITRKRPARARAGFAGKAATLFRRNLVLSRLCSDIFGSWGDAAAESGK